MTGIEGYKPPAIVEVPYAPVMHPMDPGQAYYIDTYGADLSIIGEQLGLTDRNGRQLFPGGRSSVRVIIGENGGCDYLDVIDLGACPWYDEASKIAGNFALFRWSETKDGDLALVGAETLEPGKILDLGHRDTIFSGAPYPKTVADKHVTVGIQRNGRLLIRNHRHDTRTEIWNMQFGTNVYRPVLLGKEELEEARRENILWHIGSTGTGKDVVPFQRHKRGR